MNAWELAKAAGKAAVLEKIEQAGIFTPDAQCLTAVLKESEKKPVYGALQNADLFHIRKKVFEEKPQEVVEGLQILQWLLEAPESTLFVPEGEDAAKSALEQAGAEAVLFGKPSLSLLENGAGFHPETLAAVAQTVSGTYEPGAYLCGEVRTAQGAARGPVRFVKSGEKLFSLFSDLPKTIKAVYFAGRLSGPEALECPLTLEEPTGDGRVIVFDERCCMVAEAEKSAAAFRRESCGKCTFCREGLYQFSARLEEITHKRGDLAGLDILKEIGQAMRFSCNCSLGREGARFAMETFEAFRGEYEAHCKRRVCPTDTCTAFWDLYIDPQRCTGCGKCLAVCPENALEGLPGFIHMVEDFNCTRCGACEKVCPEHAVVCHTEAGSMPVPLPDRLTRVGRFQRY